MASSSSGRPKGFPTFFKVIMGSTSDTTLIIPPEFIRRFGHYLPNPVFLKLPNGKKLTEVELNHVNGQILMSRGWPEFKQRLSLGFGHFLLFEFDWNSQFKVRIFDTSAVEITYPLEDSSTPRKRKVVNVENREEADVVEISDDDSPVKKSLRTTVNHSSLEKYGLKTKSSHPNTRSQRSVDCRVKPDKSTDHHNGDFCSTVTGTTRRLPRGGETSIAYQRAVAFASRLNTHKTLFFIRLMQKTYVSGRFSMKLPLSFAGPSLPSGRSNSVTIVTDGGKCSVKCVVSGTHVFLSVGWKIFVKANRLKVGDACIFQVAADKNNKHQQTAVWNVVIFPRA